MWEALEDICQREGKTVNEICTIVEHARQTGGFTSALRVHILSYYRGNGAFAYEGQYRS